MTPDGIPGRVSSAGYGRLRGLHVRSRLTRVLKGLKACLLSDGFGYLGKRRGSVTVHDVRSAPKVSFT